MAKKTNKTSHVLNLITNGEPEMPQEAVAPAATAPAPADSKVTVVNADMENSEVSEEIQKQLLGQLAEEENMEKATVETETEENVATEVEAKPEVKAEAEPKAEAKVVEAEPELEAAPEAEEEEITYNMVNVMEKILQRTDVLKHMRDYEVCTCSRCRADVLALVLTRLPAKYVVVDNTAANPMISYYESRFRMRILTEMIKSCIDVRDHPRH